MKRDGTQVVQKQLSGYKKVKIAREQAMGVNTKLVSKFQTQVKQNREEEQHDFTTADKLRSGGAVNLKSLGQIASNLTTATASGDMEKKI